DWGTAYQPTAGYYAELNEFDANGNFVRLVDSFAPDFGENVDGWHNATIRSGYKYAWTWFGVSEANGIQFQLPRDSVNYNINCNTTVQSHVFKVDAAGNFMGDVGGA